ncbi:MAG: hypothetical protein H7Z75_03285 [Ferruginibacter sp.]|nr:hypothetical protein [Cytophagales bacterium]
MHIVEFIIGVLALAVLAHQGYLGHREQRRQRDLTAYYDKVLAAATDALLLKVMDSEQLPGEEDIRWELTKQAMDNRHWQPHPDHRPTTLPDAFPDRLLERFYRKVIEAKVPETLRRQAFEKLQAPPKTNP